MSLKLLAMIKANSRKKKLVELINDLGFIKLSVLLCERSGGHNPWFHIQAEVEEPDFTCMHCGEYVG